MTTNSLLELIATKNAGKLAQMGMLPIGMLWTLSLSFATYSTLREFEP